MINYRYTVETDVLELSETMRLADVLEVGLAGEGSVHAVLAESVRLTDEPVTAVDGEGNVVAIFGLSWSPQAAIPWMLSSSLVGKHGKEALRLGRDLVRHWQKSAAARGLPVLVNWIHKENHSARRFISHLGFTIYPSPGKGDFDFFLLPCANPQP